MYNNRTEFDYDFAVLELDHEVDCSDFVSPVCLPDNTATAATYNDKSVYSPDRLYEHPFRAKTFRVHIHH
jgi:hypothetical protein